MINFEVLPFNYDKDELEKLLPAEKKSRFNTAITMAQRLRTQLSIKDLTRDSYICVITDIVIPQLSNRLLEEFEDIRNEFNSLDRENQNDFNFKGVIHPSLSNGIGLMFGRTLNNSLSSFGLMNLIHGARITNKEIAAVIICNHESLNSVNSSKGFIRRHLINIDLTSVAKDNNIPIFSLRQISADRK